MHLEHFLIYPINQERSDFGLRDVEGNWIPLEFNNVVLSSLSVFIISKGTLFVDSHLSSFWTHISVVHEMTLTFDINNP